MIEIGKADHENQQQNQQFSRKEQKMKKFWKETPPHRFLAWVLVLTILLGMPVSADVGDNLNGWLINFLGYGKENNTPDNYGGSIVERLNYLEAHTATKEDISKIDQKISSIKGSSDLQADSIINTYLQQFRSGGYLAIRDYTSSAAIQEAMATSSIVINSDRSGVALDWLISQGRPLHEFFDKLNGFNYSVPNNYSIDDFIRDDNCWNHLRNAQYKTFVLNFSTSMKHASALGGRSTSYSGELITDYVLDNVFIMNVIYTGMHSGNNGNRECYKFKTVSYTDAFGNNVQLVGNFEAWNSEHPRILAFDVYKSISRLYAATNTNEYYSTRNASITVKYVAL